MTALSAAALPKISAFSQQDLSNTVWSFANLSVRHLPLFEAIAAAARTKLAALDYTRMGLDAAHKLALDLNACAWAFAFVTQLALAQRAGVLAGLVEIGRQVDQRIAAAAPEDRLKAGGGAPVLTSQYDGYHAARGAPGILPNAVSPTGTPIAGPPVVLISRPGTIVVFKPAGWEVDSTGGGENRPHLSSYVQQLFSKKEFPLVHLFDFGYGFLHRLDIPSSGLVLVATTFEGLYSLRGQLNIYHLSRQYTTLCHALAPPWTEVAGRVDASSTKVLRSIVGDVGRPSQTFLRSPAHLRPHRSARGGGFCVVVVNIRTGRRHQIRAHTRYMGHPTVADSWYCPEACVVVSRA